MKNYNRIYILGAHNLAYSYYKKLKAACGNELNYNELICVDDKNTVHDESIPLIKKSYTEFILDYLEDQNHYHIDDTLIPDHTAKHVFLQVYLELINRHFPKLSTELSTIGSDFKPPFVYKSENDSIWALSYSTWTCPADCVEPDICPHTQKQRNWDFNKSLQKQEFAQPNLNALFHKFSCQNILHEIAHIPMKDIIQNVSEYSYALQTNPPQKVLVATHSHCHGIIGQFRIESKDSFMV